MHTNPTLASMFSPEEATNGMLSQGSPRRNICCQLSISFPYLVNRLSYSTHPAWLRAVVLGPVSSAMCCGCFVCCLLLMGSIIVFCLSVVKTFFAHDRSIFYMSIKFNYAQKSKMFC